jgi:uncharacterized protein
LGFPGEGRSTASLWGVHAAHFILYVADQARAAAFYRAVLEIEPRLDVPGMTEFELGDGAILGLMPEAGIERLLEGRIDARGPGSRAELYLVLDEAEAHHARSLAAGAEELSAPSLRGWGDVAGYSLDPDRHVLAFARRPTIE